MSDITAAAPGDLPFRSSSFICFPLKTKNGGMTVPAALPHEMMVVVLVLGLTTAWVLVPFSETTPFGACSVEIPVSSMLYIKWGMSDRFFSENTLSSSL